MVEPERQKIMVKGAIVKDEPNWSKYKLKEKMMLMMMGTPSGNEVKAPEVATVFVEDQEGGAVGDEYMPRKHTRTPPTAACFPGLRRPGCGFQPASRTSRTPAT